MHASTSSNADARCIELILPTYDHFKRRDSISKLYFWDFLKLRHYVSIRRYKKHWRSRHQSAFEPFRVCAECVRHMPDSPFVKHLANYSQITLTTGLLIKLAPISCEVKSTECLPLSSGLFNDNGTIDRNHTLSRPPAIRNDEELRERFVNVSFVAYADRYITLRHGGTRLSCRRSWQLACGLCTWSHLGSVRDSSKLCLRSY